MTLLSDDKNSTTEPLMIIMIHKIKFNINKIIKDPYPGWGA